MTATADSIMALVAGRSPAVAKVGLFDIDGKLPASLPHIEGAVMHATDDHTIDLDMPRAMDLNRVFATLGDAGIRVRSMRTKSNRLEELFVRLTGDDDRAGNGAAP